MTKKISIITITLNSERYLEQTVTSVLNQTYEHIEYIVIDGGSTDGTLDIIQKYNDRIDNWISEPDKGIADAMNKGLALATGDYILFLHSDDYLLDATVLEQAAGYLSGKHDIYLFQVLLDDQVKKRISKNRPLNWYTNFKMGSCHQGQLCSRKLFKQIGTFDTEFKMDMDYDWILRTYRAHATSKAVNISISVMRLVGISSQRDWASLKRRFQEEKQVHLKNCPSISMRLLYEVYWSLYMSYRKSLSMLPYSAFILVFQ